MNEIDLIPRTLGIAGTSALGEAGRQLSQRLIAAIVATFKRVITPVGAKAAKNMLEAVGDQWLTEYSDAVGGANATSS